MDLILGLVFSTIGSAYFVYGRKQRHGLALASGVALILFPMLVSQVLWLTLGSLALMAVPFVVTL